MFIQLNSKPFNRNRSAALPKRIQPGRSEFNSDQLNESNQQRGRGDFDLLLWLFSFKAVGRRFQEWPGKDFSLSL
jgi:hypothetical protein